MIVVRKLKIMSMAKVASMALLTLSKGASLKVSGEKAKSIGRVKQFHKERNMMKMSQIVRNRLFCLIMKH